MAVLGLDGLGSASFTNGEALVPGSSVRPAAGDESFSLAIGQDLVPLASLSLFAWPSGFMVCIALTDGPDSW